MLLASSSSCRICCDLSLEVSTKSWSKTPTSPLLVKTALSVFCVSVGGLSETTVCPSSPISLFLFFAFFFLVSPVTTPTPLIKSPVSVMPSPPSATVLCSALRVKKSFRSPAENRRRWRGSCRTLFESAVLKIWRWYIFSSIVPAVMRRYTVTSFFWPNLQALSLAWRSVCGFQSGSKRIILLAPTKLTPTPPVLVVRSIPKILSSLLNLSTRTWRAATFVLPSILRKLKPFFSTNFWMRLSIIRVWLKMSTR
mmetsp:Transcript_15844/g.29642  ORF Transcript_15844/g.29642 Transcript_15844/m.29642 type:complete len:253 (-) Transcript_15844:454-1212(-)